MPFVRVFGWTIPAEVVGRQLIPIGERGERLDGGEEDREIGDVVELRLTTAPMSGVDADAFEALLDGLSHSFPMDEDLFSFSGLAPMSFTATISAVQSKHGGNSASITSAQWAVAFVIAPSVWTVVLWRWSGAAWVHYVVRSDGAKWVDGVRNDAAATAWLTFDVTLGVITITGSPTFYDDVLFANAKLSTDLVVALATWMGTNALPDMRKLTYDGTVFQNSEAKVMRAFDVESESLPHMNDSSGSQAWDVRGRRLSFTLLEARR